jgi:hypothetical protein
MEMHMDCCVFTPGVFTPGWLVGLVGWSAVVAGEPHREGQDGRVTCDVLLLLLEEISPGASIEWRGWLQWIGSAECFRGYSVRRWRLCSATLKCGFVGDAVAWLCAFLACVAGLHLLRAAVVCPTGGRCQVVTGGCSVHHAQCQSVLSSCLAAVLHSVDSAVGH